MSLPALQSVPLVSCRLNVSLWMQGQVPTKDRMAPDRGQLRCMSEAGARSDACAMQGQLRRRNEAGAAQKQE